MKIQNFDLIINGGGMVGASLACALAQFGFRVALIEATEYGSAKQPSFDGRALALTYSSGVIFRNLQVWQGLSNTEATAIRHIHVTDAAAGGYVRLRGQDVGREALGWNVAADALGQQLLRTMAKFDNISIFSPTTLRNVKLDHFGLQAELAGASASHPTHLHARVLVIADGSNSKLREQLNFHPRRSQYRQSALVCRVESDRPNRGGAYEHFTRSGPIALLPFGEAGYSVVWTLEPNDLKTVTQLSRNAFLLHLQEHFQDVAGQFRQLIGERKTYPLVLSHLQRFVRPRVVVVGNASHTVHPVAGQGFNLGLRDIAALAQVLSDHQRRGWDIGSYDVLVKYERWRTRESVNVTGFTDTMIRLFANEYPVLTPARSWGLDLLQTVPPIKRLLLQRTMGIHGRQPALAVENANLQRLV